MKKDIFGQVAAEIEESEKTHINIVPGYSFNQYETVNRIYLYRDSKFETGDTDNEGFQKHFYNLSKFRCQVATKAIDIDTKDINIIAENNDSYYPCWYFETELKQWMKEQGFGRFLNKGAEMLPVFGSVVAKLKEGSAEKMVIDLRNFYVDQQADYLDTARYIIEKHYYTPEELSQKTEWDNINEAIENFRTQETKVSGSYNASESTPFIEVYERYGEVPESWVNEDGDSNKYVKALFIVTGPGKSKKIDNSAGLILYKTEIDKIPYEEVHWAKTPGRWLGIGMVEDLFGPQVRINELVNLQAKRAWWTSLQIFQTRDELVNRNLLADASNGDILQVNSEITPIMNEGRNITEISTEMNRWEDQANNIGFTHAPITGERMPAGTPLGLGVLQSKLAGEFFDLKREELGMFVKRIIWNIIIPQFAKNANRKHVLNLLGESKENIKKFETLRLNAEVNKRVLDWVKDNKDIPTMDDMGIIELAAKSLVKEDEDKFVEIEAGEYEKLKYKVDVIVTGERVDVEAKLQTLQTAMQLLVSNPAIVKDPQTKKVFFKMLDLAGIDPTDFELEDYEQPLEEQMTMMSPQGTPAVPPQGGSVSVPPPAEGAAPMPIEEKV